MTQELFWESLKTLKSRLNRTSFSKPSIRLHLPLRKFIAANKEGQKFLGHISSSYTWLSPLPAPAFRIFPVSMVGRNGYVPWCSLVVLVPPPSLLHLTQVPTRTTALPRSQHHSVHGHLSQDLLPQSKSSALGEETNNTKKPTHKKTQCRLN